ncbi:MAG TPA: IS630 family transposase [Casimicrobiaceae bacterium]|nr:IS630 family transposase [Casimicrobiaceae bacterium]
MRVASAIELDETQREKLVKLAHSNTTEVRLARRAGIVLLAADGLDNREIAEMVGVGRIQVGRWRKRYATGGLKAIEQDLPRGGRKPKVDAAEIVRLTTQTKPQGATQWSTRTLAAVAGVSDTTVQRIWQARGLKPHRVKRFKVSRDPRFVEKLEDIVGLYMSPPEHALVLCCDEKSQVQALDRTQPGLPIKPGRAATLTHDYKRNGTTTLFAAMNTLDGTVISRCEQRHRHSEWLAFLRQINRETPQDKSLHLICDNYATHKHPKIKEWLAKHPRFQVHFTPTSASWLNMVERFFRDITTERLRHGVFRSVPELIAAIQEYITLHNKNPKPFVWTAKANDILAKVIRANRKLSSKQNEALH